MIKSIFISSKIELDKHHQAYIKVSTELLNYIQSFKLNTNIGYSLHNKTIKNILRNNQGLILSGNGDINQINKTKENLLRDKFEKKILNIFLNRNKPILCICRGFQFFASLNKGIFKKSNIHIKKNHNLTISKNSKYVNRSRLKVNSYHNFIITNFIDKEINIISKTEDGSIEIAEHKSKKLLLIMFHPERKNISQKAIDKIIGNFFK